jgi:hypothetical protein
MAYRDKELQDRARKLAAEKGIKYTEALRALRMESSTPLNDIAEVGTCKTCGQELIHYQDDVWHPHTVPNECPDGMRPGHDNFIIDEEKTRELQESLANNGRQEESS